MDTILTELFSGVLGAILMHSYILSLFTLIPAWVICKKAGKSPPLALLALIPGGIFFVALILGLNEWTTVHAGMENE